MIQWLPGFVFLFHFGQQLAQYLWKINDIWSPRIWTLYCLEVDRESLLSKKETVPNKKCKSNKINAKQRIIETRY